MNAVTLHFLLRLMVPAIVTAWPASSRGAAETLDLPAPTGAGDYLV